MTQEEKQLLIKDLSPRLPYGVIVSYQVGKNTPVNRVLTGKALDELMRGSYVDEWLKCSFKPYLRPMSSMTEEEKAFVYNGHIEFWVREDYCNKHHLDYCGLIEKGLAFEAPNGMYKDE